MSSTTAPSSMAGFGAPVSLTTGLTIGWIGCAVVTTILIIITLYQLFRPFAADRP